MLQMGSTQLYGLVEADEERMVIAMLDEAEFLTEALVDPVEGLVVYEPSRALCEDCDHQDDQTGLHMKAPLCKDHEGVCPMIAATILSLYGFGGALELYDRIVQNSGSPDPLHLIRPDRFSRD
jgi:hypothetical protein